MVATHIRSLGEIEDDAARDAVKFVAGLATFDKLGEAFFRREASLPTLKDMFDSTERLAHALALLIEVGRPVA